MQTAGIMQPTMAAMASAVERLRRLLLLPREMQRKLFLLSDHNDFPHKRIIIDCQRTKIIYLLCRHLLSACVFTSLSRFSVFPACFFYSALEGIWILHQSRHLISNLKQTVWVLKDELRNLVIFSAPCCSVFSWPFCFFFFFFFLSSFALFTLKWASRDHYRMHL